VRDRKSPHSPLEFDILGIWQALLGRNDIGVEDDFFELGGDSLLAVNMLLEVETIACRKIPLSMLTGIWTIRQLAARILETSDAEEILTCAKKGSGTPLFFCHGDFKTRGLWALKLFGMIKSDQPVVLIKQDSDPDPNLTIEDIARSRLPHLLAAQPVGPVRIGGFCNGSLIAWELAHQLERLGRRVERVVLIDAISINARPILRMIVRLTRLIAAVAPKEISEKFRFEAMDGVWRILKRSRYFGPYRRAMSNYLPPRLNSDLFILICEERRDRRSLASSPWYYLASNVQTRYISGSHTSCITTHARELASVLDAVLLTGSGRTNKPKIDEASGRSAIDPAVNT
jgi:oxalate---CoA ligase